MNDRNLKRIAKLAGMSPDDILAYREYPEQNELVIVDRDYIKRRFPLTQPKEQKHGKQPA